MFSYCESALLVHCNPKAAFGLRDIRDSDRNTKIRRHAGILNPVLKLISAVAGPKYDVEYLRSKIRELLGDTKLSETLTNVVIPAFAIKFLHPTIFSSFEMKSEQLKDAMLSDICIGTSAAPTYFPAHYFATEDAAGGRREFNLVDGCVAANNPTLAAMSQVTKAISLRKADFFPICRPTDYGKFLVILLGAGSNKQEKRYSAKESGRWGVLAWLYDKDTMVTPIVCLRALTLSPFLGWTQKLLDWRQRQRHKFIFCICLLKTNGDRDKKIQTVPVFVSLSPFPNAA
ncbi:patatin-like protein 2 [Curcuma longa]|uniref:patatin-like protein 2 n=1 Tax=Curcuma longa TaxID=136217 RepID=UPI003D9F9DB6